jgi:hypothetical protein
MDALRLAQEANVKHLVLFQHDPGGRDHALDTIVALCNVWSAKQHCSFTYLGAAAGGQIHL